MYPNICFQINIQNNVNFWFRTRLVYLLSFVSMFLVPLFFNFLYFDFVVDVDPLPLQVLCRSLIRSILRKTIQLDPTIKTTTPKAKRSPKQRGLKRLVVPIMDTSDDTSDDDDHEPISTRNARTTNRTHESNTGSANSGCSPPSVGTLLDFVFGRLRERRIAAAQNAETQRRTQAQQVVAFADVEEDNTEEKTDVSLGLGEDKAESVLESAEVTNESSKMVEEQRRSPSPPSKAVQQDELAFFNGMVVLDGVTKVRSRIASDEDSDAVSVPEQNKADTGIIFTRNCFMGST